MTRGLARRVEPGQQHRRFDLRRGHRQRVFDRHRVRARRSPRAAARPPSRVTKRRAEARQRVGDTAHRPAAQRGVAGDEAGESGGSRGCRAAAAPRCRNCRDRCMSAGSARPPTPTPSTSQRPSLRRSTPAPSARIAAAVAQHVLAFEQAGDLGAADRERAQHQRAVRDRFVARHPDRAGERRLRARAGQRRGAGESDRRASTCVREMPSHALAGAADPGPYAAATRTHARRLCF